MTKVPDKKPKAEAATESLEQEDNVIYCSATEEEEYVEYEENNSVSAGDSYLGNFRITGYVATGNKTASGTIPSSGRTVAMNREQMNSLGISYGDSIYIDGLGTYAIEDCGCKWGVIDVFCDTVSDCYALTSYADAYN